MRGAVVLILGLVFCSTSPFLVSGNVMEVEDDSSLSYLDGSGVVIAVADTGIDTKILCKYTSNLLKENKKFQWKGYPLIKRAPSK